MSCRSTVRFEYEAHWQLARRNYRWQTDMQNKPAALGDLWLRVRQTHHDAMVPPHGLRRADGIEFFAYLALYTRETYHEPTPFIEAYSEDIPF